MRDDYVDVAKGICILLVVCIHTEVFGVIGMPFTYIAVPMFFFMSGFYDKSDYGEIRGGKLIRTLIVPSVFGLVYGYLILSILHYIKLRALYLPAFNWYEPCATNGPIWFLVALFYAKITTSLLFKIKLPKYVILLVSVPVGYVGSTFQMPLLVDEGLAAFPLYYIGKLVYPQIRTYMASFFWAVTGLLALGGFYFHFVYFTIAPVANSLYRPHYLVALFAVMMTFIPIVSVCKKIAKVDFLTQLGRHSLGIMLLHSLICHITAVTLNRVFDKGSVLWMALSLATYPGIVYASYYLTVILERYIPIVLGKQKNYLQNNNSYDS